MRGKFIVVEGLEGAGKSSVIQLLVDCIEAAGHRCVTTREPGGTAMAEAIRECVKQPWDETVAQETELMLMYAARRQLLINKIFPALNDNVWVVGDRHELSSQAYQGGGRQIDAEIMATLSQITLKGFKPDLTLYLDVTPETGLQRARGRGELDRIEQEGMAFFKRTRERYLELAASDDTIITIDTMRSMELVHRDVIARIKAFLEC
ncbi:dTMP kinase [Salinimonas sp. HHU 13199]|uniref:Thymidylate kinase n=1 Tax=Salinimonas profundi TaxID=2729140 RepID=A0ABR8LIH8_9ALTE|nr:dTMP kinase [Salinimonas profundi]MBD3584771.1 dTMP kinase [Salinimonas profundi]